jgi:hypothetical protein
MSGSDPELERWQAAWKADGREPGPVVPERVEGEIAALRRRVKRRSLGLALMTLWEVIFTSAAIFLLWRVARSLGTPLDLFTLTSLAALAALAFAFTVWNRWGIWRPATESTSAYLDLSIARCGRRQRGLKAGWTLLAAEVFLFVPWIWHRLHLDPASPPQPGDFVRTYGFLATICSFVGIALGLLGRRTRRETRSLEELREALTNGG